MEGKDVHSARHDRKALTELKPFTGIQKVGSLLPSVVAIFSLGLNFYDQFG
jgi:hypothetical protein